MTKNDFKFNISYTLGLNIFKSRSLNPTQWVPSNNNKNVPKFSYNLLLPCYLCSNYSNYLDKYSFFWNALTTLTFAHCKNTWDILFNVFTVDCLHTCKALADFFQWTRRTNEQMESVPSKCASKKILRI